MLYDVTFIALRPGTQQKALTRLAETAPKEPGKLLAVWTTDIGLLNQVLIIRETLEAEEVLKRRAANMMSDDPLSVGEFMTSYTTDTYQMLPFIDPLQPCTVGPFFEVRRYLLQPGQTNSTIERWREALPARNERSKVLLSMNSLSGVTPRFMHVWPYNTMDQRMSVRAAAMKDGVWPPPGGGNASMQTQQNEIYVPAPFSPIK